LSEPRGKRPSFSVIGAGRAGGTLAVLLADAGWTATTLWSRSRGKARTIARRIHQRTGLQAACPVNPMAALRPQTDVLILAVPDQSLGTMASRLAAAPGDIHGTIVLHLSGASEVEVLAPLRRCAAAIGSLHPLSILTRSLPAADALRGAGFAVAGDVQACKMARRMVKDLDGQLLAIDPARRAAYHLGASLVANDTLALMHLAVGELRSAGVSEERARQSLAHLLGAAARSVEAAPVHQVLTGPVVRGDLDTLASHLEIAGQPTGELHRLLSLILLKVAQNGRRLDPGLARRLRRLLAPRPETRP
jgi:predicted short-subunit dehydrogenase-like oxidoreductase (DUF2520 family)